MQAFTRLSAVAAPIDLPNVDTDRRFAAAGSEKPDFVLNRAPYREAKILVADENFGCGFSREMAVWTLEAYGVRAVIAPSLGDIFHQNCVKNGLLPVILPGPITESLRRQLHERPGATADRQSRLQGARLDGRIGCLARVVPPTPGRSGGGCAPGPRATPSPGPGHRRDVPQPGPQSGGRSRRRRHGRLAALSADVVRWDPS